MRKFYTAIVNHRKTVISFFVIMAIIGVFLFTQVGVDYDINDYLPEDSISTIAIDLMQEEFEGGIPNARVMIKDVTIPEALEYKNKLLEIEGVDEVTWLDDSIDMAVPLSTIDQNTVETYYKNNTALYNVTLDEKKRVEATEEIRNLIGEENALVGNAICAADATTKTLAEVPIIIAGAIAFVIFVLVLTTNTWLDPVIVMVSLGIAIAINAGTNIIFGTISFVTNASGNILQLAVSLDYSVFLLHRYRECKALTDDPKEAMVDALCKSTTSILSSGLTTVIGFLALCIMRFLLGPDMGYALAKGVAFSLITVFLFTPCFILSMQKFIDKCEHRSFMPDFHGFGKFISKVMVPLAIVFIVCIAPSYLASNANSYIYGSGHLFGDDSRITIDTKSVEDVFGQRDTYVLMVPNRSTATEKELSDKIHELKQVTDIISFVDNAGAEIPKEYLDDETLKLLDSGKYSRMVISVKADYEGDEAFALIEEIRNLSEKYYPGEWYLAGQGVSTYDLKLTVVADMVKVNLVAILAVFLVMVILQRDLILPVLLVLSIETATWINLSIPYFTDQSVYYIAYLIISSIQLGATVDYAILMSDRYKEMREKYNKKDATVETISSVAVSILTSASVLIVIGFLMGFISSNQLLAQLGKFIGFGGTCSLFIVIFIVPGLLYIFDRLFIKKPLKERLKDKKEKLDAFKNNRKNAKEESVNG